MNIENGFIYVGVHKTLNPDKFDGYLGCGVYVNQPSTYNYPKTKFQYAVKKYGPKKFKRTVLKIFNNPEDAYCLETIIVNKKYLERPNVYNQVLGGHGGDIAQNAIPCYQYSLDGKYITGYSSHQEAASSVERTPYVIFYAIKYKVKAANYFWSKEKVECLNLDEYKLTTNKIPVFQYSKTGEYDCCYESIADAARVLNTSSSNIVRGIKLGYLVSNKYFSYYYYSQLSVSKTETIKNRRVYQYSISGEYLGEYKNEAEACRSIGKNIKIGPAIKLGHTAGGYQWSLEKLDKLPPAKTNGKARKVGQFTVDGKLIKIFNTVTECRKEFSGCRHVLSGRNKTSGGYVFKYIE